jgi:hypothetical protein
MFNVSIREYFSVLNVSIVCIRNTARSKLILLLCTHMDSYKFSIVHPPSTRFVTKVKSENLLDDQLPHVLSHWPIGLLSQKEKEKVKSG